MIKGVVVTPHRIVEVMGGDVLHVMKNSDEGYCGFGEAYFSSIHSKVIKAWKRHHEMVMNLVVPVGKIRVVLFDDRVHSQEETFHEVILSQEHYSRLTVLPMIWVGFQGMDKGTSFLLNIASIHHDPLESDNLDVEKMSFDWRT